MTPEKILEVKNLKTHYPVKKGLLKKAAGYVRAVDGVSFDIHKGETVGLVGESGCGKSTLGLTIMRLEDPTEGQILFEGTDVVSFGPRKLFDFRKRVQMVFQDPYASLNPRMTVADIIGEPMAIHGMAKKRRVRDEKVVELLDRVGLTFEHMRRYPHEFSGGQRQRIAIARALAVDPTLIVADEPVSALDVSIQAQVINIFKRLQHEFRLTYLFISHDLSVVKHISDRILVMYSGKVVEKAEKRTFFHNPVHPYSQSLISAIPIPDPSLRGERRRIILKGDVPTPLSPPDGCRFWTRCFRAKRICQAEEPILQRCGDEHMVACHLWDSQ